MAYWDTSALLKLYVTEHDSAYFLRLIASAEDQVLSSAIATTEALCALHRKERAGDLKPGGAKAIFRKFTSDLGAGRVLTIPYGGDIVAQAESVIELAFYRPRPVIVRSLDLIHVSSALAARATVLVATDTRLREIAAIVHLKVLP